MEIITSSRERETRAVGERMAGELMRRARELPRRNAVVLTLSGELGAGKTAFAKGVARGLGCRGVVSPTFTLMRSWKIGGRTRERGARRLYHVDAYRLKGAEEAEQAGIGEVIRNPENIVLVEWPERIAAIIPSRRLRVVLEHGSGETERSIRISGLPKRS